MIRISLLTVALFLGACAAPPINVPPLAGDTAFHSPNGAAIASVEGAALRHVLMRYPPRERVAAFALPAGTLPPTYRLVQKRLPEGSAVPASEAGEGAAVYRVAQVYLRRAFARVDIIRPTDDGREQLVSVFLSPDTEGWFAHRSKLWNIPVAEALRLATPPGDDATIETPEPPQTPETPETQETK